MVERQTYTAMPAFTGRNVPVTEIAKAMHKDAQYVRVGLQQGAFKFGYAIKLDGSNEYNYYCPDRKVWEEIVHFQHRQRLFQVSCTVVYPRDHMAVYIK